MTERACRVCGGAAEPMLRLCRSCWDRVHGPGSRGLTAVEPLPVEGADGQLTLWRKEAA